MIYWYQENLKPRFDTAAKAMVVASAFSIPMSTAMMSISTGLLLLFWLLSGNFGEKFRTIGQSSISLWALGLFLLLAIGLTYTSAEASAAFDTFGKYKKLLFVPIIISLLLSEKWRRAAIYGFALGMTIILLISCLRYFSLLEPRNDPSQAYTVFKSRIAHGIFMAFYFYLMVQLAIHNKTWRWIFSILAALACFNLLFVNNGRSGYVVFACLLFLLFYQKFNWKGLFSAGGALTILVALAFFTSTDFRDRITESVSDVQSHVPGEYNHVSGIRYRIEYYLTTIKVMKKSPLIGHGTGSLATEYKIIADEEGLRTTDNPHNEFMMITAQLGVIGLFLLCGLLYSHWRSSSRLDKEYRHIQYGLLVTMISGCMLNSLLLDSGEGKFYVIIMALILSVPMSKEQKITNV